MSAFSDRMLLQLSATGGLTTALSPAGSPPPARLRTVVDAVYDLPHARIDRLAGVTVRDLVLQRPLFPVQHHVGTWTGVVPSYSRSDVSIDRTSRVAPVWIDLLATVVLRAVVEVDAGAVESVRSEEVEGFATLEEFRSRFRFIDLDDFMARHGLSTVEDLREAHGYLLTEVRLRAPPVFDPDDPANGYDIDVTLAVLVRDQLDLTAALRDAKLVRALARDVVCAPTRAAVGEVVEPYALAVVFPRAALVPQGPTEAAVHDLFAREGVLSLFVDPA